MRVERVPFSLAISRKCHPPDLKIPAKARRALFHRLHEARAQRNVVVLDKDAVRPLFLRRLMRAGRTDSRRERKRSRFS